MQAAESARNTSRARGGAHYETAKSHLLPGLIASARAAPNYRAAVAAPEPRVGWLAGGPAVRPREPRSRASHAASQTTSASSAHAAGAALTAADAAAHTVHSAVVSSPSGMAHAKPKAQTLAARCTRAYVSGQICAR